MGQAENADLRNLVRDLAMRRESHDRRQLYWALIQAKVWTPVRYDSLASDIDPGDLHPLDREALGGMASFAVFTHQDAADQWQKEEAIGIPLRLEHARFVDLLPTLLGAGAGSVYLNPASKYSGELYRHELETCLDGAQKLAKRVVQASIKTEPQVSIEGAPPPSFWARLLGWIR